MHTHSHGFDEAETLNHLRHYLPAQATLKDFVHHNTLHAFQHHSFFEALNQAQSTFGYKVLLNLNEYRKKYRNGEISDAILERVLRQRVNENEVSVWKDRLINSSYQQASSPRVGQLRRSWKTIFQIDMDSAVHPILFRIICSYLDQGISKWDFPVGDRGLFASVREIEKNAFTSFFKTAKIRHLMLTSQCHIPKLLNLLLGDRPDLFEPYLYDQQFAHQGWSGIVASIEENPASILHHKKISLKDLIRLELLLELDALEAEFGNLRPQLGAKVPEHYPAIFSQKGPNELFKVLQFWHESLEWTHHDAVLAALSQRPNESGTSRQQHSFQALFCIDDRECSIRRHLEISDPQCLTYGTPGFFGVAFYYQPEGGKFHTKMCPAPVTPTHLIKEMGSSIRIKKDAHFSKRSHQLAQGWIISQTLGFWSAFKLFINIFRPTLSPATAASFLHMDRNAKLTVECKDPEHKHKGLQIGFTVPEMADRVEGLLRSIGLIQDFAPIVYLVGHGASSTNNPHYAAYDCGACSGRPGSVNARVASYMANHPQVRQILAERGLIIPASVRFVGAMHDTTRDEIEFYDVEELDSLAKEKHLTNEGYFHQALDMNAKERSRRLDLVHSNANPKKVHEVMLKRSVSLFEPRPELNHTTNSLCIIGRRNLTQKVFLDRRAFLNSYNYALDPEGKYLLGIVRAAAPVCGGINLEYFFSRVDNQKLGAGSKLPHNVMGLIGVANGVDGDLRPGLPSQMIELHDPVRLMILIEHFPDVVLKTIQIQPETYEWFANEWVKLVVLNPETGTLHLFSKGQFQPYSPLQSAAGDVESLEPLFEKESGNLPFYHLSRP